MLRQILTSTLSAWIIASIIFLLSRSMSPANGESLGLDEHMPGTTVLTPAQQQAARQQLQSRLGLHQPLFYFSLSAPTSRAGMFLPRLIWHGQANQYHAWAEDLLQGQMGISYRNGVPVADLLATALPRTLLFTVPAALAAAALALLLAIRLAARPWWRPVVLHLLVLLDSIPLFLLALLLLLVLANPDVLTWFPAYGMGDAEGLAGWDWLLNTAYYLMLPMLSLVLVTLPGLTVQLEAALQRELTMDYVTTARAKGLSIRQIIRQHTLRNAIFPLLTLLADLLPAVLAGAVVVEVIFALPGMGRLLSDAATARDYPVLLGALLVILVARLVSYILADAAYRIADPRLQQSTT
ncbi:ABC transporter permease [Hymenobacter sp. BT730]|uniref:ABC transporter permease n=1 Tax=Hymenobacter sp. BT730 TaxID=3063332 RepID=UPI0026DEBE45|nr:ABC transporter permease [Hymenobacter sp. BT730]